MSNASGGVMKPAPREPGEWKMESAMKICTRCILPETFPGIHFNQNGECNYCQQLLTERARQTGDRHKYSNRFLELIEVMKKGEQYAERPYDIIMAYSGGKDSSFTLWALTREFQLNVLPVTFNHGFLSPLALANIKVVCTALEVDHLMLSPDPNLLATGFREAIHADCFSPKELQRASGICNLCINLIKSWMMAKAVEMAIPMIAYGWSPGQIPIRSSVMALNAGMVQENRRLTDQCIRSIIGDGAKGFMLQQRHFDMLARSQSEDAGNLFYNISPLAFLDYDEDEIIKKIQRLGWKQPQDTDVNSTNCLLNAFAIEIHQKRFGFHPYALEIAGLVRQGHMSRAAGLKRLSTPPDPRVVERVAEQLGVEAP